MTIGPPPACMACLRFNQQSSNPVTCHAYPHGIPDPIWLADVLHTRPYPGDGGILFEPVEGYSLEADGSVVGPDGPRWTLEHPEGV